MAETTVLEISIDTSTNENYPVRLKIKNIINEDGAEQILLDEHGKYFTYAEGLQLAIALAEYCIPRLQDSK